MRYRVEMAETARRDFRALEHAMQGRVAAAVNALADTPRPPGCKRMRGKSPDVWRIRVGDYRVVYEIRDNVLLVLVVAIGHRREVYRRR